MSHDEKDCVNCATPEKDRSAEATEKSIVRLNAEKDPDYRPYCMRCPGRVRMSIIEPFFWGCMCGARHDERVSAEATCGACGSPSPYLLFVAPGKMVPCCEGSPACEENLRRNESPREEDGLPAEPPQIAKAWSEILACIATEIPNAMKSKRLYEAMNDMAGAVAASFDEDQRRPTATECDRCVANKAILKARTEEMNRALASEDELQGIRTSLLARIDSLSSSAAEAFEVADDLTQPKDIRERMRAKGHRLKATAHELGRSLLPSKRGEQRRERATERDRGDGSGGEP